MSEFRLIILSKKQIKQQNLKLAIQEQFPESSILQHPAFADRFYAKRNYRVFRLNKNDVVIGYCLVSEYLYHAEIQFGPLIASDENPGVFIDKICSFYKKRYYGQIKMCFPTGLTVDVYDSAIGYISENYKVLKHKVGNWSSLIIDLNEESENIQEKYSENLKRNIKKALQQGLHVKQLQNEEDIKKLGNVFDKLYQWREVRSQWNDSPVTFMNWFRSVELHEKIIWFGVFNDKDELLGGIIMVNQGKTLFYQIGASDPEKRNLPVLHLCFHQALLYAKKSNYSIFDFGGYDTDANENDQTYNINLFKKQFGGKLIPSHPNVLITLNKPVKILFDFLMSFRKH
jgi:hypothetical protein